MLSSIIIATAIVSLISFLGILVVYNKSIVSKIKQPLISIAAGALLTVVFFDLLPESLMHGDISTHIILQVVFFSIIFFFILEKYVHWHHCGCNHKHEKELSHSERSKKALIVNNLVGDAIHNSIDGFLIAAAFLLNIETGIAVTIAVILHEIPLEISDFGLLLHAGVSRKWAFIYNGFVGMLAILSGILFYYFAQEFTHWIPIMSAFAAGNFIYLALADILPEIHKSNKRKDIFTSFLWFMAGIIIILLSLNLFGHSHEIDDQHDIHAHIESTEIHVQDVHDSDHDAIMDDNILKGDSHHDEDDHDH